MQSARRESISSSSRTRRSVINNGRSQSTRRVTALSCLLSASAPCPWSVSGAHVYRPGPLANRPLCETWPHRPLEASINHPEMKDYKKVQARVRAVRGFHEWDGIHERIVQEAVLVASRMAARILACWVAVALQPLVCPKSWQSIVQFKYQCNLCNRAPKLLHQVVATRLDVGASHASRSPCPRTCCWTPTF